VIADLTVAQPHCASERAEKGKKGEDKGREQSCRKRRV
jgi:hypothetical protein